MSLAWTHMMAYEDVRTMLALARDGASIADWRDKAFATSRLLNGSRRATQFRYATAIVRTRGTVIDDADFLQDVATADAATTRDLIYARYLVSVPLAVSVARGLFHPMVGASDRAIRRSTIEAFIVDRLAATSPGTRARSFSSVVTEFARAGVVQKPSSREDTLHLTAYVPALLALSNLINDELRERREASDTWLANTSLAATVFALPPNAMLAAIEALVQSGRLRRSYYAGEPRILAA